MSVRELPVLLVAVHGITSIDAYLRSQFDDDCIEYKLDADSVLKAIDTAARTRYSLPDDCSWVTMVLARPKYKEIETPGSQQRVKVLKGFEAVRDSRGKIMDLISIYRHYESHLEDKVRAWSEAANSSTSDLLTPKEKEDLQSYHALSTLMSWDVMFSTLEDFYPGIHESLVGAVRRFAYRDFEQEARVENVVVKGSELLCTRLRTLVYGVPILAGALTTGL